MREKLKFVKFIVIFILVAGSTLSIYSTVEAASNITVVIDPGHGGPSDDEANLGACYNGLQEKDINLITAMALKKELEQYGNVTVYLTRTGDTELSLKQRIDYAKKMSADVVVSVHHNASGMHLFYGSEVFVPSKGEGYATGYGLASCIMKNWINEGLNDKGIKTRIGKNGDYYGLIRMGAKENIPTIILEHGYIDNYHDIDYFNENSDYVKMGKLDAKGIASYYGLKKGLTKKNVYPTVKVNVPNGVVKDDTTGPENAVMKINYYNPSTGEVRYTLSANEKESKIMYYGAGIIPMVDEKGVTVPLLTDVFLWGNGKTASGKLFVPAGYTGPVYGICYNNYNEKSNTTSVILNGPVGLK